MLVPNQPVPVILLELDEEFNHTGIREPFDSQRQAGRETGVSSGYIYTIRNPEQFGTTATDKRTGLPVTFVHADSTEEEILGWLKHVKDSMHKYRIAVKLLKLDRNFNYTGEFEIFDSTTESEKIIGSSHSTISGILNSVSVKTTKDKRTNLPVTFVRADATEEEIEKWLDIVKKTAKISQRKIKVVYVKSGKAQLVTSIRKASKATGINQRTISKDIKRTYINPNPRYHKDTNEEIEFYEA